MSIASKLKKANKAWQGALEDKDSFERRPDGKYKARLSECKIMEADTGNVLLITEFLIKGGEEKDKKTSGVFLLINKKGDVNEVGMKLGARALAKLGAELPESLEDIEDACKKLKKKEPLARIRLSTKEGSDYQNLSVDKLLDDDDASESGSESEEASESESEGSGSESESEASESESEEASESSGS